MKAIEMQPEIVLLDIELPIINGIDAAKSIRQRCPQSKIIFLSTNVDSEIIEAALAIGDGYVQKAKAALELLDVMALHWRFVS